MYRIIIWITALTIQDPAKVTGTIEEGCKKLPKTMKLRARCEAEIESKLSLEKKEELLQSARDERGTRERERDREREECSA